MPNSESLHRGKLAFSLKKITELSAGGAVLEEDLRVEFVLLKSLKPWVR